MSLVTQKRTRSERVAALELPPGLAERTWGYLQRGDVLLRLGMCVVTALLLWAVTSSWAPPLAFRGDYTPQRDIVARVKFQKIDQQAKTEAQDKARRTVRYVYELDPAPIDQLVAGLKNRLVQVTSVQSLAELDDPVVWQEFFAAPASGAPALPPEELEQHFQRFHDALAGPDSITQVERAASKALEPYRRHGLIKELPQRIEDVPQKSEPADQQEVEGNQQEIVIHRKGDPASAQTVRVGDVLIGEADSLKRSLLEQLPSNEVAQRVFDWLQPRLLNANTLTLNLAETRAARDQAVAAVGDIYRSFSPGDRLALAGHPLTAESMELLRLEHQSLLADLSVPERIYHSLASLGMFVALSILCGVYVLCYERQLLQSLRRFSTMLSLIVITVGVAMLVSRDSWRAEIVPLVLFAMTVAIAYHQELALLLSAAVALVIVVAIGQGLGEFIILSAAAASAILQVARIRSRRKLIYVGLGVGLVAFLTTIGVYTLEEQTFETTLTGDAARFGLFGVMAGFLMTGMLPFIESLFNVQTEISLLELGDVAHPLLQELVRRAPGTYNHSINVASIAEAAAEAIGANGLLVRVGAYFHDIGKMLKPGYFVENQGLDRNRHESLVPAMSTLIIIAHIKDGADLARQHHLPEPIIDFIQQHHGTTLVEYFYRRANEQNEDKPDAAEVEETAFRYPGPKPQTREAGVLMLADSVESASRALIEPTPARIESLVHDMAMKRLLDGQFDCCGLTLQELATVEDSLAKSLTAVYHGRVKYPDQRSA